MRTADYAVIDDFLPATQWLAVREYIDTESFRFVHEMGWFRTYRLEDGNPLEGPTHLSRALSPAQAARAMPTGKGIDALIKRLDDVLDEFADIVGHRDRDWVLFTARAFLYPRGTALSWHNDRDHELPRSGAFAYYAHECWKHGWGGELLLAPPAGGRDLGRFVMPAPDRLVLIRAGVEHAIQPVLPAAGDAVRASIAGFMVGLSGPKSFAPDTGEAVDASVGRLA